MLLFNHYEIVSESYINHGITFKEPSLMMPKELTGPVGTSKSHFRCKIITHHQNNP